MSEPILTAEQENHLADIKAQILARLDHKYRTGAAEHGGILSDMPLQNLIAEALSETIDQSTYLITALAKLAVHPKIEDDNAGVIQVKPLMEGGGILAPQLPGDAGFDLVAAEDTEVAPFGSAPTSVPIGIALKLPEGYWAEIRPRSSTATKLGLFVFQSCMDNLYTGPWFVVCNALSTTNPVKVAKGTRIAQCILHRLEVPQLRTVDELPVTARGSNGFGSTGSKA